MKHLTGHFGDIFLLAVRGLPIGPLTVTVN